MRSRGLLWQLNLFYMATFLGTGALFGLATVLCRTLACGQWETALVSTMAAQFAPGLAALLTVRALKLSYTPELRLGLHLSALLCLLVPLTAIGGQHLLLEWLGRPAVASAFFATLPLVGLALTATLLGSIAEEIGWRGYLYSTLRTQLQPWFAGAITGLLWGLWHFTKIFSLGLEYYLLFTLSVIPLSILMSYLNDKARRSLLPSIVLHTVFNLASMWLLFERETAAGYLVMTAGLGLILAIVRVFDPLYFKQNAVGNPDAGVLNVEVELPSRQSPRGLGSSGTADVDRAGAG